MKMNVENKLNKVVKILKEKGFVVYRKGGKEPGVFYAKEGDSRTRRKLYIQSWKEQLIRSGMRQKRKDVFESPDGLYIEMVYENKAFVSYRPIKETQDLPIDAKYIPLLTRIFGENILAEIGGGKIFITTGKYAVNFWCWGK